MIKNFTDLNKFSKKELDEIIKIAKKIKKNPKNYSSICKGKTLGMIGCGNIGSLVVERCLGLKMKILVFDPFLLKHHRQLLNIFYLFFSYSLKL